MHLTLLISMLVLGIVYGLLFHFVVMPFFNSELLHCLTMGLLFGLTNYLVASKIIEKYNGLVKSKQQMKKKLAIDPLTGLLNRRAFDFDIDNIGDETIYSVVFIDIDNFRYFNNKFGHDTGDEILRKVSEIIKAGVRKGDQVYRYGGEELVLLLKSCDKRNAMKIAEKVRSCVEQMDNSPIPQVTISLGVASFPEDGKNIKAIIKASDYALLNAKKQGKNRTICWESEL